MPRSIIDTELLLKKERKKQSTKKSLIALFFITPFIALFIFYTVIPLGWGIITSFLYKYNPWDSTKTLFDYQFTFENYRGILTSAGIYGRYGKLFWNALGITFVFNMIAVPCLIIFPLFMAYLVNLRPFGYKFFRSVIYLPSILSQAVMGAVFLLIFSNQDYGFINSLVGHAIPWMDNNTLRWLVILIASIWWQSGLNFIIFLAALRDIDKSLYEASALDGCGRWKQFISVTLPGIKNQMIITLFTTIIGYMSLYAQPKILTSIHVENPETPMLMIQGMLTDSTYYSLVGMLTATSFVFAFIVILISAIQMKATSERKGGVKYATRFKEYNENTSF